MANGNAGADATGRPDDPALDMGELHPGVTITPVETLLQALDAYLPDVDEDVVRRAYALAARSHRKQKRKSGLPYIIHPIAVAQNIMRLRLDEASVAAALLHDVVEDTEITIDQVKDWFGDEIAHIVEGVTKLDRIQFSSRQAKQAENFRKMLVAMSQDIRVLLIKLADRLHNMSTLDHMPPHKRQRIAQETVDIYAPLANRLGIHWMKSQLEDLCFHALHPDAYAALRDDVGQRQAERLAYVDRVRAELFAFMEEAGLPGAKVTGRPKHLFGIWQKMQRRGLSYDEVYDAQGFRVLVEDVESCYRALGAVHTHFTPIPGRFKDYIALSKANNYQSLHTTVIGPENRHIEVQIRTHEMHRVAEMGVAAHWRYKEGGRSISVRDEERFAWLKQLLEWNSGVSDDEEFLDTMKIDLFNDEVYTFTPAGEVRVFPRGATPIDFAYSVHSKVGEHTVGAKANGVMVPLNHELRNGDIVEILTRNDARPNQNWLDWAKSARAKHKIRNFIRGEQREQARETGLDLLEKAFRRVKMGMGKVRGHAGLPAVLERHRARDFDALCVHVGYGKVDAKDVVLALAPDAREALDAPEQQPVAPKKRPRRVKKKKAGKAATVRVAGMDDVLVRFAKCCSPVPGDDIVGFVTRGRGITVHRRDCARALDTDPLRRIDCDWNTGDGEGATVTVRVHSGNAAGMLARMSERFHEAGINILQAHCRVVNARRAVNEFEVVVTDVSQLAGVMAQLERLDFVQRVERVGG